MEKTMLNVNELNEVVKASEGFCVAKNSIILDSDAFVKVTEKQVCIHFARRIFKDIIISFDEINDIKYDHVGEMTIAILYLAEEKTVSIHCLP